MNIFKNNTGRKGEEIAVQFLKKKGYTIEKTNYKNTRGKQLGEIDIIAQRNGVLTFIEVKTRTRKNSEIINPEQNITREKIKKINKIIQLYLSETSRFEISYQLDAITVILENNMKPKINHLENIFY